MTERIFVSHTFWLVRVSHSTTERDYLYSCGRLDSILDLLRDYYGKGSHEYSILKNTVRTVESEARQRLGLTYPDDEQ